MSATSTTLKNLILPVRKWDPVRQATSECFAYVDLSSVDRETKTITAAQERRGAEAPSRARQLLSSGDVLVSTVRPNLNAVAVAPEELDGATGSTGFCVLRSDTTRLDIRYLFHWVRSSGFISAMVMRATGASYPAVSNRIVKESKIPLPPLPEQRRIAAILDKADAVRRKRQQTLDLADQFLRSSFLDMFGDPVTNPKGWPVRKLGDVAESKLGKMLSKASLRGVNPVEYLGNSNVRWRHFDLSELATMDFTPGELQKLDLRGGDLLVCEGGEIGRCAIWYNDRPGVSFQKALHRVRCNREVIIPEYVQETLMLMAERGGLVRSTSVATIAHLTGVRLRRLCLPLPPIGKQKAFAGIYSKYRELSARCVEVSARGVTLRASLVQRAFRGEL